MVNDPRDEGHGTATRIVFDDPMTSWKSALGFYNLHFPTSTHGWGVGEMGKIECKLTGPKRFWKNEHESHPDSKLVISDRKKKSITEESMSIDPTLLEVGDHNGSTFYQHEKFQKVVAEGEKVEVGVEEGVWAVRMGLAAQLSVIEKRAVKLSEI